MYLCISFFHYITDLSKVQALFLLFVTLFLRYLLLLLFIRNIYLFRQTRIHTSNLEKGVVALVLLISLLNVFYYFNT